MPVGMWQKVRGGGRVGSNCEESHIPFKEFEFDPIVAGAIPSTYLNNVRE